jgi:hypothetical protein
LPPKYFTNQPKPQSKTKRNFTAREMTQINKAMDKDFEIKKQFLTRKKSQLRAQSRNLEKKLDKKVKLSYYEGF